jgi:hypothetical protein
MRILTAVLALLLGQSPPKILLEAPEKTKTEDLEKAARAIADRCKAFGYPEVSAKAVKGSKGLAVEIASKSGITQEMERRIRTDLAAYQFGSISLALQYWLSEAEQDAFRTPEFKPGAPRISKAPAPEGAQWVAYDSVSARSTHYFLLWKGSELAAGDFTIEEQPANEKKSSRFQISFTPAGLEKLGKLPAAARAAHLVAIIDGGSVIEMINRIRFDDPKKGEATSFLNFNNLAMDVSFKFPMAIRLK